MTFEIWFAYLITVLFFMVTPGPSHLLMLSNSMAHGFRPSLATALGDLSANSLQILAAGLGLASLVLASQDFFTVVKWAGVAYLVYLGIQKIRTAGRMPSGASGGPGRRSLFLQGFLTSAVNPKAVVFFAGLFPLFLDPGAPPWHRRSSSSVSPISSLMAAFCVSTGPPPGGFPNVCRPVRKPGWTGRRAAS